MAEMLVEDSLRIPGLRSVCIREVQKTLKESAKRLIEDKIQALGVGGQFEVLNDHIKTPGGGIIIFQGMQDHSAESIKSLENFGRAWVEEAQTLSETSLQLLRPTIREEGSELWFSWNPRRKTDPVDKLLRQGTPPTDSIIVEANWNHNPWFPKVLEQERLDCEQHDPDQYGHIWEGEYVSVVEGAYFAKHLAKARKDGRIGRVAPDPHLPIKLFADIGGTGAKSDAFVFWAAQFVGQEVRILNHYEVQGQELGHHLNWLRENDYTPSSSEIWLPHDGATHDKVFAVSYESAFNRAGYKVTVVPNQGRGAAGKRIEEARRLFPQMWFNEATTEAGRDALGWYHEKRDENRNVGLGPEHDWASHSADAFGLMCVAHQIPKTERKKIKFKALG